MQKSKVGLYLVSSRNGSKGADMATGMSDGKSCQRGASSSL